MGECVSNIRGFRKADAAFTDHCIEHVRASLMCAADLTPQRFSWDPHAKSYVLEPAQMFQCRDFDKIWDWAESRNSTGDVPDFVEGFGSSFR